MGVPLVIVLIGASALGFLIMWGDRSINIAVDTGGSVVVGQSATVHLVNSTVAFENYFIGPQTLVLSFVESTFDPLSGAVISEQPLRTPSDFSGLNLTVTSISIQSFYGSQPLDQATTWSGWNLTSTVGFEAAGFTKLVITMAWSWTLGTSVPMTVSLATSSVRAFPLSLVAQRAAPSWVHAFAEYLRSAIVMPFELVTLAFLWIFMKGGSFEVLSRSYGGLVRMRGPKDEELANTLNELAYRPGALTYRQGVSFGAALALFKLFYRRMAQQKLSESKLRLYGWEAKHAKSLQEFLKDDATSPASSLFEARTIALVTGFLASLGLSLSWNLGAMAPLVLVVGLAYLFWNLGGLLYLVRKDARSAALVVVIVILVILAVASPDIIVSIRGLS